MLPGVDIVWLFDPKDIALILNDAPGNFPRRRSHLALEKYRTDRPHIYRTGGLLPTWGDYKNLFILFLFFTLIKTIFLQKWCRMVGDSIWITKGT